MKCGTVVGCDHRRWGLWFLSQVHGLPLAESRPAMAVCAAYNGRVTSGNTSRLPFIHNSVLQGHWARRCLVNPSVIEPAFVQNGHGENARGNNASRVGCNLNYGSGAQFM